MIVMKKIPQPLNIEKQIRVNERSQWALKRIVAEMSGRPRMAFKGRGPSQEALVCASWLWMESMGWDALEEALAPHMDRLNAIVKGLPDPGVSTRIPEPPGGVVDGVNITTRKEAPTGAEGSGSDVERGGKAG